MANWERIRDQIHGFIKLSDDEMLIIDTQPFQRLRRIHQLAFTHFIYPGAEHTRFPHSLGVMHLATTVFESAWDRSEALKNRLGDGMKAHMRQVLRLYALLHDLGHGPFSHAGDGLFPTGTDHEEYSRRLLLRTQIGEIISDIGDKAARVDPDRPRITPELIGRIIMGEQLEPHYHLLRQIMTSEADADKMDYLLRDSYNCGVSYGQYDLHRLLQSFMARPFEDQTDSYHMCLDSGGLHAFEAFVLARYWMFLQVYFHRTRRIYDMHRFMIGLFPDGMPEDLDEFLELDDYMIWSKLREAQRENPWAG